MREIVGKTGYPLISLKISKIAIMLCKVGCFDL